MMFCIGLMLLSVLAVTTARGESAALRFHCAGTAKLTADTNLATLNRTLSEAQAVAFRRFALNQVATLISQSWQLSSNVSPLIDPLLADVLENESVGAMGLPKSNATCFITAVRVDPEQAQLWTTNLGKLFGAASDENKNERFAGKHWNRESAGDYWVITRGNWLLFGRGSELASLRAEYLQKIGSDGSPVSSLGTNWLEGDLDLGLLAPALPEWAKLLKPTQLHIQIAPRGNDLEIRGKATYPEEIPWTPGSWQEPKSLVQSPLISFTAGQNVAALLQISPQILNLADNFLTNQFYSWALGMMPLESYLAWPVADGTNSLKKLSADLPPLFNPILKNVNNSQISWKSKTKMLVWSGLNVVAPTLAASRDKQRDYLLLSLLPNAPPSKPAPPALWKELESRQNLVYYDWELTGQRLQQMRLVPRMLWFHPGTVAGEVSLDGLVVKDEMLGAMNPQIGVTVTEVTRTAPNELFIIRKGPIGLTGFEMVELSDWLSKAASQ
jgi:hypothetical protein